MSSIKARGKDASERNMANEINRRSLIGRMLALGAISLATGCRCTDDFLGFGKCGDEVPRGAIPQPVGTYSCQWQQAQMTRAEQDDFAIYEKEWIDRTAQLSDAGRDHLTAIARRMTSEPFTVVIEPTSSAALNEARRAEIMQYLIVRDVPGAEERVMTANPDAEGMLGQEAISVTRGYFSGGGSSRGQGGNGQSGRTNSGGGFGNAAGINSY